MGLACGLIVHLSGEKARCSYDRNDLFVYGRHEWFDKLKFKWHYVGGCFHSISCLCDCTFGRSDNTMNPFLYPYGLLRR